MFRFSTSSYLSPARSYYDSALSFCGSSSDEEERCSFNEWVVEDPSDFSITHLNSSNYQLEQLECFSKTFEICSQLKILDLSQNKLRELPPCFGEQFIGLKELILLNNQLAGLPESFGKLANLTKLNLGNNQLTSISNDSLKHLTKLTVLILDNNQLESLPESIDQLPYLRKLHISSNHS